mmetsp:Transcript_23907/g.80635  ORF Transcript_23907/g.80635 Transcript_23907/m.80635 type:complete len:273 (+) Transcript_23907:412-1230(+)
MLQFSMPTSSSVASSSTSSQNFEIGSQARLSLCALPPTSSNCTRPTPHGSTRSTSRRRCRDSRSCAAGRFWTRNRSRRPIRQRLPSPTRRRPACLPRSRRCWTRSATTARRAWWLKRRFGSRGASRTLRFRWQSFGSPTRRSSTQSRNAPSNSRQTPLRPNAWRRWPRALLGRTRRAGTTRSTTCSRRRRSGAFQTLASESSRRSRWASQSAGARRRSSGIRPSPRGRRRKTTTKTTSAGQRPKVFKTRSSSTPSRSARCNWSRTLAPRTSR